MGLAAVVFLVPLQLSMLRSLRQAKPQPRSYPLARSVTNALEDYIDDRPYVELILAGQPSSPKDRADVVLVIGAPRRLEREYANALIDIVRRTMKNDKLVVEVHCIRELWQEIAD
jgi:hypothetical protein